MEHLTGEARLDRALDRVLELGTLSPEQAAAVRDEFARSAPAAPAAVPEAPAWRPVLAEIGGYIGAAFILAAGAAVLGALWSDLGLWPAFSLLAVAGALVLGLGVALGRGGDDSGPRRRLVSVLLLGGAGLLCGAAGRLTEEGLPDSVVPAVGLTVCLAGYAWQQGILLHVGLAGTAWWSVLVWTWAAVDDGPWAGLVSLALGVIWAAFTLEELIEERDLGILIAGIFAFTGAELLISDFSAGWTAAGWVSLLGLAVAGLAGYALRRELSMLAVGGVALVVLVPQFVVDKTDGAFGAAGAFLLSGLIIVAGSVWALRVRADS